MAGNPRFLQWDNSLDTIYGHVIRSHAPVLVCHYICLDVNKYTYKCNKFSLFSHRLFVYCK